MRSILRLCSIVLACRGACAQDFIVSPPGARCVPAADKLTCNKLRLRELILYAFDLPNYQLAFNDRSGFERHDLEIPLAPNATADQARALMRGVLAGRFHSSGTMKFVWFPAGC